MDNIFSLQEHGLLLFVNHFKTEEKKTESEM